MVRKSKGEIENESELSTASEIVMGTIVTVRKMPKSKA